MTSPHTSAWTRRRSRELRERLDGLDPATTVTVRDMDPRIDGVLPESDADGELLSALAEMRLVKDDFEIAMLQQAVDSTVRGFEDVVKALPDAMESGERVVEGVFNARARLEGNDTGYSTIAASGAHATVLHWVHNDGDVAYGDLLLVDAGVECRQLYTADVTRTLPVSGRFTPEQREVYQIVLDAQRAAMDEVRPGVPFMAPHRAAMRVLAEGLHRLGILTVDPEVAVRRDQQLHRRWTIHGTSHMLGLDVHDCNNARDEQYHGELKARLRAHHRAGAVLPARRPHRARALPGHRRAHRGRRAGHRRRLPQPLGGAAARARRGRGLDREPVSSSAERRSLPVAAASRDGRSHQCCKGAETQHGARA